MKKLILLYKITLIYKNYKLVNKLNKTIRDLDRNTKFTTKFVYILIIYLYIYEFNIN